MSALLYIDITSRKISKSLRLVKGNPWHKSPHSTNYALLTKVLNKLAILWVIVKINLVTCSRNRFFLHLSLLKSLRSNHTIIMCWLLFLSLSLLTGVIGFKHTPCFFCFFMRVCNTNGKGASTQRNGNVLLVYNL